MKDFSYIHTSTYLSGQWSSLPRNLNSHAIIIRIGTFRICIMLTIYILITQLRNYYLWSEYSIFEMCELITPSGTPYEYVIDDESMYL